MSRDLDILSGADDEHGNAGSPGGYIGVAVHCLVAPAVDNDPEVREPLTSDLPHTRGALSDAAREHERVKSSRAAAIAPRPARRRCT